MAEERKAPELKPLPEVPRPPEAAPELQPHAAPERPPEAPEVKPVEETAAPVAPVLPVAPAPPPTRDPELIAIENILAEGLEELYREMPRELQAQFRAKGEETASRIKDMIHRAKVKARRVLSLIKGWLRLIPGVSRFFLEQEAKIKTDKILAHAERKKIE